MFAFQPTAHGLEIVIEVTSFESSNATEFVAQFMSEAPEDLHEVVIDFSKVDMIDSSAIGALLAVHKRITDESGQVVIRGAKPAVVSVIELLRLHRVFKIEVTGAPVGA